MVRKKKVQEKETKIKRIEKKKGGAARKRGGESRNQKRRRRREGRKWARDESNGPKRGEPDRFGSRKKKPNQSSLYIRARGPV